MLASASGKDKFRAGLPKEVEVGHKTGMSYRTPEGIRMCDADVGVIYMPGGDKCYLAVLVKDSKETDAANAKIMADSAKKVYVISLKYANGLRNGANSDTHRCKQLTEHGEERCIKLREVAGFSAVRTIFQIVGPRKILHCLLGK